MHIEPSRGAALRIQLRIADTEMFHSTSHGSTLDRKRIYANPSSYPNPDYNFNPKAQ